MSILERLKVKHRVEAPQQIKIVFPNEPTKIAIKGITIIDEQTKGDFDISDLTEFSKRLEENKLKKVTVKPSIRMIATGEAIPIVKPIKKPKKLTRKRLVILQEEGVDIVPETIPQMVEEERPILEKEPPIEEEMGVVVVPPKIVIKKRKTIKAYKGISILNPVDWVDIDGEPVVSRLPTKIPNVQYKVSSYFMNNREIFINAINTLFEPYRDQIMDDSNQITCDSIGSMTSKFSLLTHQLVVRDYMNIYTPYRGLLLYHGLGSGKTCTSIALAEGMKSSKKIIIMTPASLRSNYMSELKKCGNALYNTNQYWEWIDTTQYPNTLATLSSILNLTKEYIERQGGAWLVNVKKTSNFADLSPQKKGKLNDQINEMIESKYQFINYNGLRRSNWAQMSNNFEINVFDNAVVIIDEAHNLISRIVNKIGKEKAISIDKQTGEPDKRPVSLSMNLYLDLLRAKNAKVILMSGTPVINYPNELGIMFNILRGYIKQWEFTLDIKTTSPVNEKTIQQLLNREKILDYMEYSPKTKRLVVTRNPFGFENVEQKSRVQDKPKKEEADKYRGVAVKEETISDEKFEQNIVRLLKSNDIELIGKPKINQFTALPDKFDDFVNMFIDASSKELKNDELLKRRIMGLSSYFKSAQEKLLPRYDKLTDLHVIKIPMSDYQFGVYEEARKQERKMEKSSKQKKGKIDENGLYKEPTSTYRIFSRLFCNFVMPKPPGRPLPIAEKMEEVYESAINEGSRETTVDDNDEPEEIEVEGDNIIDNMGDASYEKRMQQAIEYVDSHASEYLSIQGLETYGPKYLHMLENIQDSEHVGLHLVYSQFRTLEGIGLFKMVLEENGFTQFKIKKGLGGEWELNIKEENRGKPTFALYTGTESKEEKEAILEIYNGDWSKLTPSFAKELRTIANNNNMGEIIKVLMITASGSEGINLKNTRYVHIMEPYWHPARVEQVIGRARRICSHKDLPDELQTVEVYIYLMSFSPDQIKSDASIELKQKDLSKRMYPMKTITGKDKLEYVPFTSDEALYEISTIKEDVNTKLTTAIKESSIDCSLYSKSGSKEQLHCLQFGNPKSNAFSYRPDYKSDAEDKSSRINKEKISWRGVETNLRGKTYISRKIAETGVIQLYDIDSYKRALEVPGVEPTLLAVIETNERGEKVVRRV